MMARISLAPMVKRFLVMIMFLLLVGVPQAHSQGVNYFEGGDVYAALRAASSQRKLLLVEFSASWSYKSRWMSTMMNSSAEVCELLNRDFIVYRVDTRERAGAELAQVYSVTDYPYILVFDSRGTVLDRVQKSMEASTFLEFLEGLTTEVDKGIQWSISQMVTSADKLQWESVDDFFSATRLRYSDMVLTSYAFWDLFSNLGVNRYSSAVFDYFVDHLDDLRSNISDEAVEQVFGGVCQQKLMDYLFSDLKYDTVEVSHISSLVDNQLSDTTLCAGLIKMIESRRVGDVGGFLWGYFDVRNSLPEEDGFKLAMTLDFVARCGSREHKRLALRYLSEQLLVTKISSQREMLLNVKSRF